MKYRKTLRKDEHLDKTAFGTKTVALFLGNCHGVRLVHRRKDDTHIIYEILCEDDGHWFVSDGGGSSYWLSELIELLQYVHKWMKENLVKDGCAYKDI